MTLLQVCCYIYKKKNLSGIHENYLHRRSSYKIRTECLIHYDEYKQTRRGNISVNTDGIIKMSWWEHKISLYSLVHDILKSFFFLHQFSFCYFKWILVLLALELRCSGEGRQIKEGVMWRPHISTEKYTRKNILIHYRRKRTETFAQQSIHCWPMQRSINKCIQYITN